MNKYTIIICLTILILGCLKPIEKKSKMVDEPR